jgi:hypothetical protein
VLVIGSKVTASESLQHEYDITFCIGDAGEAFGSNVSHELTEQIALDTCEMSL